MRRLAEKEESIVSVRLWGFLFRSLLLCLLVVVLKTTEIAITNDIDKRTDRPTDHLIGSYKRRNDEISEILLVNARGHNVKVCPKINMG